MSSFHIRPRFKETLHLTVAEYCEQLKQALDTTEEFSGMVSENYANIKIPLAERHFWSPQLTLSIDDEKERVTIRGLYEPKPSVWAAFFMGYAAIGVLILFVGVYGLSQILLDKTAPILWAIPVLAGLALVLYLVAQAGQKIGAEQMFRIHHFYEGIFKDKVAIH
ncbi:hypothetical protein BXY85_1835 [Roseivirga pacifica]|uniref:Uncharacterized protein n=1 Tax=Roseivirga pacifica TaxID=1267423 RepID=A0A1I0MZD6_9BACT|nr:hypothetical protein [Roseivirga pacifica]RKQ50816.1 hypothetical protein BXY85_1835 [Roseivirga pacifica]SEV94129.1 hypothetical protein SAMN05216290_0818 [Roseivirga pacifica]